MRSNWSTFAAVAGLLVVTAAAAGSCLTVDNDRACGEDHPPCYKGEVCVQGRCYAEGNAPDLADTDAGDTTLPDTGPELDTTTRDGTDTRRTTDADDVGPRDTGDAGDAPDAPDTDADTGPPWPSSNFCEALKQQTESSEYGGLGDEWTRDGGDAGVPDGHPGSECGDDSNCNGKCLEVDGSRECVHRAFLSSETFDAAFNSAQHTPLEEADCACQLLAIRAGHDGVFQSPLSADDTSAAQRIEVRSDIYAIHYSAGGDFEETLIFDHLEQETRRLLWTEPLNEGFEFDERGNDVGEQIYAWTGWTGIERSTNDGRDCAGWDSTSADLKGVAGRNDSESAAWLTSLDGDCANTYRIYCIEQ